MVWWMGEGYQSHAGANPAPKPLRPLDKAERGRENGGMAKGKECLIGFVSAAMRGLYLYISTMLAAFAGYLR